ncbi:MAG TPA: glycosyltransferase 87 family protein [Jatrophihabitans sp.]
MASPRSSPRAVSALIALLAIQAALIVAFTNPLHAFRPVIAFQIPGFALSLVAVLLVKKARLSHRATSWLLLGGCLALQVAALLAPPVSSDDDYRYAWDATVQLHGIDPYRYAPNDPALTGLRNPFEFPQRDPCSRPVPGGCTLINRSSVHTIYPPVAEGAFTLARLVSFGGRGGHRPMQVAALLGVLATTALLIKAAADRHRPGWPVAIWAWSPIVAVEASNNAHIEWLAVLTSVAGLVALRSGRQFGAGLLIGAAIATKLYPGLLLVTAGRRGWRIIVAALGLLALGYLPHVLAVGPAVIGYLPGYLREEDYASGSRYVLLNSIVGESASWLAPLILVAILAVLWWRAEPMRPELTALHAMGAYLLIITPHYAWYGLILIGLAALVARPEWLLVAAAPSLLYMATDIHLHDRPAAWLGFGLGGVLVLAVSARRRHAMRRVLAGSSGAFEGTGLPSHQSA